MVNPSMRPFLNVYAPNNKAAKYVTPTTELKEEIDKSIIVHLEISMPFSQHLTK